MFQFQGNLVQFSIKKDKTKEVDGLKIFVDPCFAPNKRDLKLDRVNNTCVVDWLKFYAPFLARFGPEIDGETLYKKSCRWILQCRTCEKKHQIILKERTRKHPFTYTVKLVLGGSALSSHPLLSGHLPKSRK